MNQQKIEAAAGIYVQIRAQRKRLHDLALVRRDAKQIDIKIRSGGSAISALLEIAYLARTEAGALSGPALSVIEIEERKAEASLQALGRELAKLGLPKPDDCQ